MKHGRSNRVEAGSVFLAIGVALAGGRGVAQAHTATVPDAQVESNVLKALAADTRLADKTIQTTTVYGTVTLSGAVPDEATRTEAETVVSRTAGVVKVIDELTLGVATADIGTAAGGNPGQETNPNLQSDRSMAAPEGQNQPRQNQPQQNQPQYDASSQQPGAPPSDNQGPPQSASQNQAPNQGPYRRSYPPPPYGPPSGYPGNYPPPYGGQQGYGGAPQSPNGANPIYGGPQGYGPPQSRNGSNLNYAGQQGGQPVNVPSGTMLQVRLNQGLDSRNAQPGTVFSGVVTNDVVAGGAIAIPRGAGVQGVVVDADSAGVLKGRGELQLKLTQVTLGGSTYPLDSDVWARHGGDKTVQTVDSAVGFGAVGAVIGAVAGGGAGAAIGAGVGAAAGVGSSAASGRGQVGLPPESLLLFRLTQPVQVATLSQAELDRLGYGVPAGGPRQMVRRYPGPYYGPAFYGPGYFYGPRYYPRYYRHYPY
jgi:hypothetical protein